MSRREEIDNSIWSDPDFAELTPHAKLIFIWSWTNSRTGMAGLYKVSKGAIVFECAIPADEVDEALAELERARFVYFDGTWLWVRSRLAHQRCRTANIAKAVGADLRKIPLDHPYRAHLQEIYGGEEWLASALIEGRSTPSRPSTDPLPTLGNTSPDPVPTVSGPSPEGPTSTSLSVVVGGEQAEVARVPAGAVERVMEEWRQATGHLKAKLDDKRRRIITAAVKRDGEEQCVLAVKGWRHFAHNRGENDRHEAFNELHTVLKDSAAVEKFAGAEGRGAALGSVPPPPDVAIPTAADAAAWNDALHGGWDGDAQRTLTPLRLLGTTTDGALCVGTTGSPTWLRDRYGRALSRLSCRDVVFVQVAAEDAA